jgi:hypothetical protein
MNMNTQMELQAKANGLVAKLQGIKEANHQANQFREFLKTLLPESRQELLEVCNTMLVIESNQNPKFAPQIQESAQILREMPRLASNEFQAWESKLVAQLQKCSTLRRILRLCYD